MGRYGRRAPKRGHDLVVQPGHSRWRLGRLGLADVSRCGRYRYRLTRDIVPNAGIAVACFVMLNPSLADEDRDDPTLRRCMNFARRWGFGRLAVVNLFGWMATDPRELRNVRDPVGPGCDPAILFAAADVHVHGGCVVCAWGAHYAGREFHRDRRAQVLVIFKRFGLRLHALGLTRDGHPRHPLRLPADTDVVVFQP